MNMTDYEELVIRNYKLEREVDELLKCVQNLSGLPESIQRLAILHFLDDKLKDEIELLSRGLEEDGRTLIDPSLTVGAAILAEEKKRAIGSNYTKDESAL